VQLADLGHVLVRSLEQMLVDLGHELGHQLGGPWVDLGHELGATWGLKAPTWDVT
jgi:hypothetical protein